MRLHVNVQLFFEKGEILGEVTTNLADEAGLQVTGTASVSEFEEPIKRVLTALGTVMTLEVQAAAVCGALIDRSTKAALEAYNAKTFPDPIADLEIAAWNARRGESLFGTVVDGEVTHRNAEEFLADLDRLSGLAEARGQELGEELAAELLNVETFEPKKGVPQ